MRGAALVLLVAGMWAHYGWQIASPDLDVQGQIWNASQGGFQMMVLGLLAFVCRSRAMAMVCALIGVLHAVEVWCSLQWLVNPWPVVAGQEQCTTRYQVPLGLLGLSGGLLLIGYLVRSRDG